MARTLSFHPGAYTDLNGHVRFISRRASPAFATRWQSAIEATILRLAAEADRYPEAYEAADLGIDLREQLHGRRPHVYRILFTIDGDTVSILRIRHAAQDRLTDDDV